MGLIFKLLKICCVSNILYFSLFKYLSLQQYPSLVEEVITNIVAVDLFIFFHNMIYKCTYRLCACILLYQKQFYPRITHLSLLYIGVRSIIVFGVSLSKVCTIKILQCHVKYANFRLCEILTFYKNAVYF